MAKVSHSPVTTDHSSDPAHRPLPRDASPAERWRFRRNLLIYLAHREGLTQTFIAEAFDLSRALVRNIVQGFSSYQESVLIRPPEPEPGAAVPSLLPRLPDHSTVGKRRRARRDFVIRLAHRRGFSQRFIADVFDLPRSWVAEILKDESPHPYSGSGPSKREPGTGRSRGARPKNRRP